MEYFLIIPCIAEIFSRLFASEFQGKTRTNKTCELLKSSAVSQDIEQIAVFPSPVLYFSFCSVAETCTDFSKLQK